MGLTGKAAADKLLRGKINGLDVIYYDTYEIAVKNGYDGTLEEWLATLEGDKQSQGRSANYNFTTPGWKRVLNIIRGTNGVVDIGMASGQYYRMVQCLSFDFTGYVRYPADTTDSKPVLIKRFENTFGEDAAVNDHPFKITKVRIGYPAEDAEFPGRAPDETDYTVNPVNCYMDIYVDFDPANYKYRYVAFNMNYAGFAESNNCEAITQETDAVDTGYYGEELTYYEVDVDSMPHYLNSDMSLPYLSDGCVNSAYGVRMYNGSLAIYGASENLIEVGENGYRPITAKNAKYAVDFHTKEKFAAIDASLVNIKETAEAAAVIDDTQVGMDAWSSKNIVDKLCPAFTESGNVAVCEPVEGYPLDVVSTINSDNPGSITLTQCGKNLFDFTQDIAELTYTNSSGGTTTRFGHTIRFPAGTYTIKATNYDTGTRTVKLAINGSDGSYKDDVFLVANKSITKQTVTIDDGDVLYVYNANNGSSTSGTTYILKTIELQIENGSVATPYEPYQGQTYTIDIPDWLLEDDSGNTYDWETGLLFVSGESQWYQHDLQTNQFMPTDCWDEEEISQYPAQKIRNIPATSGTNYFYSDCGDTTVSGRADPKPLFEKLTNAIVAMGGTV